MHIQTKVKLLDLRHTLPARVPFRFCQTIAPASAAWKQQSVATAPSDLMEDLVFSRAEEGEVSAGLSAPNALHAGTRI
jgi:hypothetical protein